MNILLAVFIGVIGLWVIFTIMATALISGIDEELSFEALLTGAKYAALIAATLSTIAFIIVSSTTLILWLVGPR